MSLKLNWDGVGIITSIICAIHCGLLPLLIPILPLIGVNRSHNTSFEWIMISIAFVVGIYAIIHGFIKHHRNKKPIYIFIIGFSFLVLKQFYTEFQYLFLAIAVSFMITAHYMNYRLCTKNKCSSPHHKH
jgi:hypothetical protein